MTQRVQHPKPPQYTSTFLGLLAGLTGGNAAASGLQQRNALDTNALFEPSSLYVEGGWIKMVGGNIRIYDAVGTAQSGRPVTTGSRSAHYLGRPSMGLYTLKFKIGNDVDCTLDSRPSVAIDNPTGSEWVGRYQLSRLTMDVRQDSATCSYAFHLGKGNLRLIGGYVRADASLYKTTQVDTGTLPPGTYGVLQVDGRMHGRRWGLAYEIPEYAMRAVLLYQDSMALNAKGDQYVYLPNGMRLGGAARLNTELPKTWQLDMQSGIREGWLAMLSVSWQQWSRVQGIPVQSSLGNGLTAYFKDAWTYTAGIGHSFTPRLSASANLSFTQGAASADNNPSGFIALPYTDAWTLGLGGKYKLTDNVNVKAGVFATRLKGGTYLNGGVYSRATEGGRYDASWLYTTGASLTVAF